MTLNSNKISILILANFALLILLLLNSCGKTENELMVDAELKVYFDRFEEEAALRGVTISLADAAIEGFIDNIPETDVAGQCTHNSARPNVVTIDATFWSTYTDLEKEYLVFHELGHCFLNRSHLDSTTNNGICKSIMNSGTTNCVLNYNTLNRSDYLNELFE